MPSITVDVECDGTCEDAIKAQGLANQLEERIALALALLETGEIGDAKLALKGEMKASEARPRQMAWRYGLWIDRKLKGFANYVSPDERPEGVRT
jgi:hypothetical protein